MQRANKALITEAGVSIFKRPEVDLIHAADEGAQITLGDLHGNTLKLLYPLCRHDIAGMSDEDYDTIVSIYKTPVQNLDASDIQKFNEALERIKFNPVAMKALVRLIGDETGDRGSNDYFTLRLLRKLRQSKIPYEIILSNHGMEFVTACEKYHERKCFKSTTMTDSNHTVSLDNLQKLIDRKLITAEEVLELYDEVYAPALKAISYSLNDDESEITYYHHGVNSIAPIKGLAIKHGVAYDDSTPVALAKTIEAINIEFKKYVVTKQVNTLCDFTALRDAYEHSRNWQVDPLKQPYEALMWNRSAEKAPRPKLINNYKIHYVHGHDHRTLNDDHITNLDLNNNLGKQGVRVNRNITSVIFNHIGTYNALYSHEHQLGQDIQFRPAHVSPPPLAAPDEPPPRLVIVNQTKFYALLSDLEDKVEELFERIKTEPEDTRDKLLMAANTASNLHSKLKSHADHHFLYGDDYDTFKTNCNAAIKEARPILEEHRGWKQTLGNIALFVIGAGLFYLGACAINKAITGRFLFFQTDSGNKVDNLDKTINIVARKN